MAVAPSPDSKFVPAWKRLGLKLKNSPADGSSTNGTENGHSPSVDVNSKKRKAADHVPSSPSAGTQQAGSNAAGSKRPLKRKKSVTFAETSKELDGDETSRLLDDYAAQQHGGEGQFSNAEISQFTTAKVHPANEPTTASVTKQSKKQKKKEKQAAATEDAQSSSPQVNPIYVTYLEAFHKSRGDWKFNKNHQTALLKNIFNPYRVPTEHDDAISAYLQGLQGEASRTRLKQTARTILDETKDLAGEQGMAGQNARDKALKSQLKQTKHILRETETAADSQSAERQDKILKRRRAALVLHNLMNTSTSGPQAATATTPTNEDPPRPRKKSRRSKKFRTGVPDDDDTDVTSSVSSVPSAALAIPRKIGPDGREIGNADAEEWKWNGKGAEKKAEKGEDLSSDETSSSEGSSDESSSESSDDDDDDGDSDGSRDSESESESGGGSGRASSDCDSDSDD